MLNRTIAVPLVLYGIQHFVSMIGSLVLIPLVIVPAMGGSDVSSIPRSPSLNIIDLFPSSLIIQ